MVRIAVEYYMYVPSGKHRILRIVQLGATYSDAVQKFQQNNPNIFDVIGYEILN